MATPLAKALHQQGAGGGAPLWKPHTGMSSFLKQFKPLLPKNPALRQRARPRLIPRER